MNEDAVCLTCQFAIAIFSEGLPNGFYQCPFEEKWRRFHGREICLSGRHEARRLPASIVNPGLPE